MKTLQLIIVFQFLVLSCGVNTGNPSNPTLSDSTFVLGIPEDAEGRTIHLNVLGISVIESDDVDTEVFDQTSRVTSGQTSTLFSSESIDFDDSQAIVVILDKASPIELTAADGSSLELNITPIAELITWQVAWLGGLDTEYAIYIDIASSTQSVQEDEKVWKFSYDFFSSISSLSAARDVVQTYWADADLDSNALVFDPVIEDPNITPVDIDDKCSESAVCDDFDEDEGVLQVTIGYDNADQICIYESDEDNIEGDTNCGEAEALNNIGDDRRLVSAVDVGDYLVVLKSGTQVLTQTPVTVVRGVVTTVDISP